MVVIRENSYVHVSKARAAIATRTPMDSVSRSRAVVSGAMDREELRRQSYEAWERMAGGWETALERIEVSATPGAGMAPS